MDNTTNNKPETLDIQIEQHLKFNSIADICYMSSVEFCELVSAAFKQIFSDWDGCKMVPVPNSNQGQLQMQFFFNHREGDAPEGMYKACSRDTNVQAKSDTLAAIRRRDYYMSNGDRFHLTEDGKSALAKFFFDGATVFNRDGSIKENSVTSEVHDGAGDFMSTSIPQQLTMVSFIDPIKVATFLFGSKDDNGDGWVYNITPKRSMNTGYYGTNNANYVLSIERISVEQTKKLAASYGLVFTNGLGIVR